MTQHQGPVHLRVGKNGITDGLIEDAKSKLEKTDPLVIKMLQNFRESSDRKQAAKTIAERTKSRIESFVGGTLILTRKRNS